MSENLSLKDIQTKQVAILGFGKEGKSVLKYLLQHGIKATVFEERTLEQLTEEEQSIVKAGHANFILGKDCFSELRGFTLAFRSPGVYRLRKEILEAEHKGLQITSQTSWFFQNCPGKIIGVTGTKGKGTTSSLIHRILEEAFKKEKKKVGELVHNVFLTGNIGKDDPLDILSNVKENDFVVFELSSFQLQDLKQSPYVGVCLMVTQDHVTSNPEENGAFHHSLAEYVEAKSAIVKYQNESDFSIYNIDYPASSEIGKLGNGKKLQISSKQEVKTGAEISGDLVALKLTTKIDFDFSKRKLRGQHNLENIAPAALVATILGVDSETIVETVRNFEPLEHRLEFVAMKEGISFYNDSLSTTPDNTIAAIKSFSEPIILILGGSEKYADFSSLAREISTSLNIKHIVLVGETAPRIMQELEKFPMRYTTSFGAKNMGDIFRQISEYAESGDVVLLSPACASFDMFPNYAARGSEFKQKALAWQKQ